jgi:ankyrin repeat protein
LDEVRFLCEAGADKDRQMHGGATPLFIAAQKGHIETVKVLCQARADKDKQTRRRATPLVIAAQKGHLGIVQFLCDAGADKDWQTEDGVTALVIATAAQKEDPQVVHYLRSAGADQGKEMLDGTTMSQLLVQAKVGGDRGAGQVFGATPSDACEMLRALWDSKASEVQIKKKNHRRWWSPCARRRACA